MSVIDRCQFMFLCFFSIIQTSLRRTVLYNGHISNTNTCMLFLSIISPLYTSAARAISIACLLGKRKNARRSLGVLGLVLPNRRCIVVWIARSMSSFAFKRDELTNLSPGPLVAAER